MTTAMTFDWADILAEAAAPTPAAIADVLECVAPGERVATPFGTLTRRKQNEPAAMFEGPDGAEDVEVLAEMLLEAGEVCA